MHSFAELRARSVVAVAACALVASCSSKPRSTGATAASASAATSTVAASASAAAKVGTRLVLLGTKGGPRVGGPGSAKNPSTLLLVNGHPYVVDCGYGTSMQLVGAGVPLNTLGHVFITHHHSDHVLELGPLLYNAWVTGLRSPVEVHGPPGTSQMVADYWAYLRLDIETRIADEGRPDPRGLVTTREFEAPGVILQNDEVTVTAARVRHPPLTAAYAYRFATRDGSVVISGDTTYDPTLADFAKGADVLVHEVMHPDGLEKLLKRVPNATTLRAHLLASHTVPADVGKIAAAAGVKTLVLSHLVPGDDPSLSDERWTADIRQHFDGRIIVGKDLLEIPVGP
ncbi:MAG TPA: MBL fold metallo-hydrolase [Polyangiaceae bacterium]|jgi:ribonuclease BN (tRNA processing enzyme)|nr:MBL fold metallo-hydrolase [Polyangiaceae bacterium]